MHVGLSIAMPHVIHIGRGVMKDIPQIVSNVVPEAKMITIVGDDGIWGVVEEVSDDLSSDGVTVRTSKIFGATPIELEKVTAEATGSDLIIGIGGGANIDIAKAAAYNLRTKFISVPTATSTDAMATPFAILWEEGRSKAVKGATPLALVADLDVIWKAPPKLQLSGFGDYIAKITAIPDLELAYMLGRERNYNELAVLMAQQFAEQLIFMADGIPDRDPETWETYVLFLALDGMLMSMCNTTRIAAGSEHLFAYALDEVSNAKLSHGESVGLGTALLAPLHGIEREWILEALSVVGLPTNFSEVGVSKEEVVKALTIAHKMRDWYTILGDKGLSEEAAERLARGMF